MPLTGPPSLSVVLVSMNRKAILEHCLLKLQDQTLQDFEIIVVDNASTDGTEDMIRSRFPHVRYTRLEANLGPPGGRNAGVQMASGDLCVFLDDDAYFKDDDAFVRIRERFSREPQLDLAALRIIRPQDGREEYKSIPRADKKKIDEDYECSYFCGAGFALRRDVFLNIGGFWNNLIYLTEEQDLSYRLMDQGRRLLRLSSVSVVHNETPQARIPGKWIYFGARNRFWVALRNLPMRYVLTHTLLWWGYYFVMAAKNRHPVFYLRGVLDALKGAPGVLADRRAISEGAIARLKALSGRVYY